MTDAFAGFNSHGFQEGTVRVCRDLERPNSFYALAAADKMFRVRPSVFDGYATERIDVFNAASARRTFASEERAAAAGMASVARRRKLRWGRLVRWLEFGPYVCPGDSPVYFSVGIYKTLRGPTLFFPVIRQREPHKADKKPAGTNRIVDVRTVSVDEFEKHTGNTAKALEAVLTKNSSASRRCTAIKCQSSRSPAPSSSARAVRRTQHSSSSSTKRLAGAHTSTASSAAAGPT